MHIVPEAGVISEAPADMVPIPLDDFVNLRNELRTALRMDRGRNATPCVERELVGQLGHLAANAG